MFGIWEKIYLGLFLFGSGFLLIQMALGQFGDADVDSDFDADLDSDFDVDGEVESAFGGEQGGHHAGLDVPFLTPLVVAPMLAGFGATGLFLRWSLGWSAWLHLPLALLGGVALGYAIFYVLAKVIAPMQGSSEVRVSELWGTVAEVVTPIPENRLGEVRFVARGSYHSTAARNVTGEYVARGQTVMIEKIENSVAIVRPTK